MRTESLDKWLSSLVLGAHKGKQSAKYASRTAFGISLGMPSGQVCFVVFDPLRASVVVRSNVKFFHNVPWCPRYMAKKAG